MAWESEMTDVAVAVGRPDTASRADTAATDPSRVAVTDTAQPPPGRPRPLPAAAARDGAAVPFVALERQHAALSDELHAAFDRVARQSAFILGEEVERFESEF